MASPYKEAVLATSGLVSLWPLDEASGEAIDVKGVSNGEAVGGIERAQDSLLPSGEGKCAKYNGTTGNFVIPDKAALRVGDTFSMEFILYLDATGVFQYPMGGGSGVARIRVTNANLLQLGKAGVGEILASTVALEKEVPYYILVTKNAAASAKIYLGNLKTSSFADVSGAVTNQTCEAKESKWRLGNGELETPNFVHGRQQYAALYNTSLSQATGEAHFTAGLGSHESLSIPSVRRKPPLELDVEIETPDGSFRLAADSRKASDQPQGINFGTQRAAGFGDGACTLARPIFKNFPDIGLLNNTRFVGHQGDIAYEGQLHSDPRSNDPMQQLQMVLAGWAAYLKRRKIAPLIIDRRLEGWGEPSIQQKANIYLAGGRIEGQVGTGGQGSGEKAPGVTLTYNTFDKTYTEVGQAWKYAGGQDIGKFKFDFDQLTTVAEDKSWSNRGRLSSDDIATSTDNGTTLTNVDSANQTVTASTTGRKYAFIDSFYGGAEFAGTGNHVFGFLNPRLVGNHGLTERGTSPEEGYYLTDIMEYVLSTYFPKLVWAGNTNSYEVTQATWHDSPTDGYEVLMQLAQYALWELAVWEERKVHFEQADLTTYDWVIDVEEPGVKVEFQGDSIENFANGIAVTYTDVLTEQTNVLYPPDHEELRDESEDNPANKHGEYNWTDVEIPWPVSEGEAIQIGRAYLAEFNRPRRPGTFTVSGGYIQDYAGHWHQGWKVRATETIGILNMHDDSARLITATSWDQDSRTLSVSVDNPSEMMDAIVARMQNRLEARNLR